MNLLPYIIQIFLPLFSGGALYVLFRPESLYLFRGFELTHTMPVVRMFRAWVAPARSFVPDWVIYSLPDALYTYAIIAFIFGVWKKPNLWVTAAILFALSTELAQLFSIVPGVFDPVDLALKMLCAGLAYYVNTKYQIYEKKVS